MQRLEVSYAVRVNCSPSRLVLLSPFADVFASTECLSRCFYLCHNHIFHSDCASGFLNERWLMLEQITCLTRCGRNTLNMNTCSRSGAVLP